MAETRHCNKRIVNRVLFKYLRKPNKLQKTLFQCLHHIHMTIVQYFMLIKISVPQIFVKKSYSAMPVSTVFSIACSYVQTVSFMLCSD